MKRKRKLLFTVSSKDCDWDYFNGTGSGGQKRNKTAMCVRCTHRPSGAVGVGKAFREQHKNKQEAFKTMSQSKEFRLWHQMECSRKMGEEQRIIEKIDESLADNKNLKIERMINGKWEPMIDDYAHGKA